MAIRGGYFFKMLDVDLTAGSASVRNFDEAFAREYIGGRGFCARFVADNIAKHKKLDPLGPDNVIVIAPGPLSGLYVPSNGKTSFAAIAPATGIYGDSNMGGNFGVEVRQAGWDALILRGAAPELSYLMIDGEDARVIPCPALAGKGNLETEGTIKRELGDQTVRIASIGPAGENRIVFACISADWSRNAGRTGMGAVWGSKNLKAIAVRGDADLPVFDLPRLREVADRAMADIRGHKLLEFWHRQGLMSVIDYANSIGILPTYNFRDTTFRGAESINGFTMESTYKIGDSACFACPMCCGKINLVKNGPYAGTVIEGPEYETAAMLGSNLGIDNFAAILRAAQLCDDLGIDTITSGNLIGAVIEGYERRILTMDDLDGEPITWGDEEHVIKLLGKIARREGIGAVLAGGSRAVAKRWPEIEAKAQRVADLSFRDAARLLAQPRANDQREAPAASIDVPVLSPYVLFRAACTVGAGMAMAEISGHVGTK